MGQKANPIGLRLGINRDWDSTWFDEKHYADRLKEDIVLRRYILKNIELLVFQEFRYLEPQLRLVSL